MMELSEQDSAAPASRCAANDARMTGSPQSGESLQKAFETRLQVPPGKALAFLMFLQDHYRTNTTFFLDADQKVPLTYSRIRELHGGASAEALMGRTRSFKEGCRPTDERGSQTLSRNIDGGNQDGGEPNAPTPVRVAASSDGAECWCKSLLSLKGTLAIPVHLSRSGSSKEMEEEAQKAAEFLRAGPQDRLSLREGLLTRAILNCEVEIGAAGHLRVWPRNGIADPADEILAREHQAHVERRFAESVRSMEETRQRAAWVSEAKPEDGHTSAQGAQEAAQGVSLQLVNLKSGEAEPGEKCVRCSFSDRTGLARFRETVASALGPDFWPRDGDEERAPDRRGTEVRGTFAGAQPLLRQLLFVLWGPADDDVAVYLDEDSLLLPEDASKGGQAASDSDSGGAGNSGFRRGKKDGRLVNYTFAPPASDESGSDDSWNYEPSSSSSDEDSDDPDCTPCRPPGANPVVDLPASAPRRRLVKESEAEGGGPGASCSRSEDAPSTAEGRDGNGETHGPRAKSGGTGSRPRRSPLHTGDAVRHFSRRIDRAIALLGGSCVPLVNSVCPTDARWMVAGATFTNRTSAFGSATTSVSTSCSSMAFCCSHAWEVLLLLKSSQHVSDALARPLHGCVDLLLELPRGLSSPSEQNSGAAASSDPASLPGGGRAGQPDAGCVSDAAGENQEASPGKAEQKEGRRATEEMRLRRAGTGGAASSAHAIREYSRHRVALSLWADGEDGDKTGGADCQGPSNPRPSEDEGNCGRSSLSSESKVFGKRGVDTQSTGQKGGNPVCCSAPLPVSAMAWRERVTVLDELTLVETKRLEEGMEFRCFINGGQVVGVSQRYLQDYFPFLVNKPQLQARVKRAIAAFVECAVLGSEASGASKNTLKKQPFLRRFVIDVYVQRRQKREEGRTAGEELPGRFKCWLLNVLPWGSKTEPLLFTWDELRTLSYTSPVASSSVNDESGLPSVGRGAEAQSAAPSESDLPDLRIIEDPEDAHASLRDGTLQLPKELQDIARVAGGRGIERGGPSLDDLLYDLQAAHADALRSQKKHATKQGKDQ
ncbi:conserved hypothetical protein [Neospora caninum Liverpool]|uniref:Uncharacterized protein n=1 Tax=Neospora caninum (strain Liverpool) TaxID=572307 RepID=F0VHW1_NEOCL|nr:conserved hypothetical protein [Neospora caninum Liverpool]CBZ53322.1 conserved hypothetical protein [Neospora caninum Liverpool]|eukprot:XP_003883354.1 conserved hypothetical protein [Neospora caninum Liverpool]